MSYLIWVGTSYHLSFISNFYLFLMEDILLLLFTLVDTHFQMSADFFNLQVSSAGIGLGLYLNIWLCRASAFTRDSCFVQPLRCLCSECNLLLLEKGSVGPKRPCRCRPHLQIWGISIKYLIWWETNILKASIVYIYDRHLFSLTLCYVV